MRKISVKDEVDVDSMVSVVDGLKVTSGKIIGWNSKGNVLVKLWDELEADWVGPEKVLTPTIVWR